MAEERVQPIALHQEMQRSYLEYAMSVIVGRALPDARDGLKPVHRRILYGMHELGLRADKPHRKCARVVGDVLGKYHPHGDGSVYEALVRLAQDFSMSAPLVDGHGNFGSLDDDPPAAMRYTECRLNKLAEKGLLADIGNECVNFTETFDGSQTEPEVLPARVPNLLINGSSGIRWRWRRTWRRIISVSLSMRCARWRKTRIARWTNSWRCCRRRISPRAGW